MSMQLLGEAIQSAAMCAKCKNPNFKLILSEKMQRRKGLAQKYILTLTICKNSTNFFNSQKKYHEPYEVNTKSVHASCQGMGLAGLKKLTAR